MEKNNEQQEETKLYNYATVLEARDILVENDIVILGDTIVFYEMFVDEIDEEPDQLIGIESEEDEIQKMRDSMNKRYLNIVAVGDEVTKIKAGDKFVAMESMFHSMQDFPVEGLKYGVVPGRMITVIKKA